LNMDATNDSAEEAINMKAEMLAIVLSLGLITFASTAPAQQLERPDTIQSFRAGRTPNWLAFDGANIWVTNSDADIVTKLRASDGAPQGQFFAGHNPQWITFDGVNIWVSDSSFGGNLSKLRASDGTPLDTIPNLGTPEGIAWDGANIWVAGFVTGIVTKIRGSDDVVLSASVSNRGESSSTVLISGSQTALAIQLPSYAQATARISASFPSAIGPLISFSTGGKSGWPTITTVPSPSSVPATASFKAPSPSVTFPGVSPSTAPVSGA
jgi:hypothetical protein